MKPANAAGQPQGFDREWLGQNKLEMPASGQADERIAEGDCLVGKAGGFGYAARSGKPRQTCRQRPSAAQVVLAQPEQNAATSWATQTLGREGDDSVERYKERLERRADTTGGKSYDNYSQMLNSPAPPSPQPARRLRERELCLALGFDPTPACRTPLRRSLLLRPLGCASRRWRQDSPPSPSPAAGPSWPPAWQASTSNCPPAACSIASRSHGAKRRSPPGRSPAISATPDRDCRSGRRGDRRLAGRATDRQSELRLAGETGRLHAVGLPRFALALRRPSAAGRFGRGGCRRAG